VATETFGIENTPRAGPDASWLDRRLQTDRLESSIATTSTI
jgi:hypothetical protein